LTVDFALAVFNTFVSQTCQRQSILSGNGVKNSFKNKRLFLMAEQFPMAAAMAQVGKGGEKRA